MMGNPQPTVPVINSAAWSQPNHVYIHKKIGGNTLSFYIKSVGGVGDRFSLIISTLVRGFENINGQAVQIMLSRGLSPTSFC